MSDGQSETLGFGGQHAVVIGASIAGLLAGRVLSEHFARVTVIERDQLPEDVQVRKGVPQGRHAHALLKKGASIMDGLFPGLFSALVQEGAIVVDSAADIHWYHFGLWKARFPSNIIGYCQSRPLLEKHIRDRLAARSNVYFIDRGEVVHLCASSDNSRVMGVLLRHYNEEQREEILTADLVVDASGRGSQTPQWLTSLGYKRVEDTIVKVDVGYASRIYRRSDGDTSDWKLLLINPTPPGKRGGYAFPIEGNRWMITLAGWLRDYPPDDEAGFLDYTRSLPHPSLYEMIKDAEPLTPIATHRFPANRWHHYERMARFPEGLVVLGDAICSFNPVYGQGMTTAALNADVLNNCLYQQQQLRAPGDVSGFAQRFHKALAKVIAVPWSLATGEDFRYKETKGRRPPGTRLMNWYIGRLHILVASYPPATLRFYEAMHMVKPPAVLFDPRIVWAVLFKR